ncbi:MAG: hypothetical protein N2442_07880 [Spirochaetes bacterium]|nr:hypothetical protein [Spirochaetota bacterium]
MKESPLQAFLAGKEVVFRVPNNLASFRDLLEFQLLILFRSVGFEPYKGELCFCIHELVSNGFKANLKRYFFQKKGLSLENMEDYRKGMEEFRSFLKSFPVHEDRAIFGMEDPSFWVKVRILKKPEGLRISVENNSTLHYYERLRILDRESRSGQIQTLTELLLDSHDTEEGAGLGLLFVFFIMKRRLKGSTFALVTEPGITRIELWFPALLSDKKEFFLGTRRF